MKLRRLPLYLFSIIAIGFLTLPLLALGIRAVSDSAWEAIRTPAVGDALWLSAWTSVITLIITFVFGTPLAYTLARYKFFGRRLILVLTALPIVLPPAVAGLALLLTFGRNGLLGDVLRSANIRIAFTVSAVVMAQVFVSAPFYIRSAVTGFMAIPQDIQEAARVDGAGGWALFWRVVMPLSSRTLLAGMVLAWARAVGEFGATIFFAGGAQGRTQTMPLLIYQLFESDLDATIVTGVLLVMVALCALLVAQFLSREKAIW
ncbi:MAG: ABC transporter permease [Anaerolineae bacterium]|nr:ABC transporter permease [Anaerolineae bacterium]